MKRFIIVCVMFFAWIQSVQAGGFQIGEMATRSTGMGSAFTAVSDDASAAWHNPAGAAFTTGSQIMVGGDLIIVPPVKYSSNAATKGVGGAPITATAKSKSKSILVPHGYYTFMDEGSSLGASISINAPFGLETEWPLATPFKTKNTFSRIQMLMINPSVIFKVNDHFSVAAGVDYAYLNNVDLNSSLQDVNGNGDGWGGNASIMYKTDAFSMGVTYRSSVKVNINGTARAKSTLASPFGATTSGANTSVTLPDQVNVGLAFKPNDAWLLSFDIDWTNWKKFDAININFTSAAYRASVSALQGAVGATVTGATNIPENWKATTAFRAGAEWAFAPNMRTRFGYVFDPTPINDANFSPAIPGNDRHIFSVGYSYDLSDQTSLDLAYAYVYFKNRHQTASPATPLGAPDTVKNGTYKAQVHIIAASLSYKL